MRVKFESVALSGRKSGKCSVCGGHVRRTFKVEHTVNPFNVNAEGMPKSRDEILADVRGELEQRMYQQPLTHERCEHARREGGEG